MKNHLKQITFINVLSCVILFSLYKPLDTQSQHMIKTTTEGASGETHLSSEVPPTSAKTLILFAFVQRSPDFYQIIVNNSLFRRLGWRPTRPIEPYRLIGMIIRTDRKQVCKPFSKQHVATHIPCHMQKYTRCRYRRYQYPTQAWNS